MTSNPHFIAAALEAILDMVSDGFTYACENIQDGRTCLGRWTDPYDCCLPCHAQHQLRIATAAWRRTADFSERKEVSPLAVRMALSVAATAKGTPANILDEEAEQ